MPEVNLLNTNTENIVSRRAMEYADFIRWMWLLIVTKAPQK